MNQPKDRQNTSPTAKPTRPHTRPHSQSHAFGPQQVPRNTYRARSASDTVAVQVQVQKHPASATARATAIAREKARRRRLRVILLALAVLLVAGSAGAWALVAPTVETVNEALDNVFDTPVPERPGEDDTPVPVVFPKWDKKEPVNILLLGLDYRPEDEDTRADTQIIVHIDPANKTAAMVSIPRDLWVPIPRYGEGRINSAYQLGERDKATTPGGGPGLAMATIEKSFGVPIHYYAQVDFTGFERMVDALGGVTIDVPKPLVDNQYPLPNLGVTRIYIPAGLQHMDGETALKYARSRHADSDIARNARQQQVLLALREQSLNLNVIGKLNDLVKQLSSAVKTDLSVQQVAGLAQLAGEIGPESIQTVVIDENMVQEYIIPATGAAVLLPRWELIRPALSQAFADPAVAKEAARLSVQNGTTTGGMARRVSDMLTPKGFFVADLSSAPDQGSHPVTTITDYTGGRKPKTVEALATLLGIDPANVKQGDPADAPIANSDSLPVDILVMVGDDRVTSDQ